MRISLRPRPRPVRRAPGVLAAAATAALAVSACGGSAPRQRAVGHTLRTPPAARAVVRVTTNAPVAPTSTTQGVLGSATELSSIEGLAGSATDPDTPLVPLLRNLSPGAPFLLRLGGQSTDGSWWSIPGRRKPSRAYYTLTPRWAASVRTLLTAVGGRALLGINLQRDSKAIAAAELTGYERGIGAGHIDAFEVGNEPESYNLGLSKVDGRLHRLSFDRLFMRYGKRFGNIASALGDAPLAGPASGSPYWLPKLGTVLGDMPLAHVKLVTVHAYALKACSGTTHLTATQFFTPAAITGLADAVHREVEAAAAHGEPLRVGEINGDPCLGAPGVSNAFAEALWALNALPALWRAGVQGVNIQRGQSGRFPNYNKFILARHSAAGWRISVEPEYYGLLAFADVAPAGAHLLRTSDPGLAHLYQFAVRAPDGTERVVLTNVGAEARTIGVSVSRRHGTGSVSTLEAPSLSATAGTTLDGQAISPVTGRLAGPPHPTRVTPNAGGVYAVPVPAHAAAILTLHP